MKSWKKRWITELDRITPPLRGEIYESPIPEPHASGAVAAVAVSRRAVAVVISACASLIICAAVLLICLLPAKNGFDDFLITLEINPSVTLSADENGTVTGVIATNSDADLILYGDADAITGKSVEEAITFCTDRAARLGYIDFDEKGSAVRIGGLGNDGLLERAKTALETYFKDRGAFAVVIAQSLNTDEFLKRSGLNAEFSAEDAAKFIKESTPLYSDRKAENLDLQGLQTLYGEETVSVRLFGYVLDSFTKNPERVLANAQDIAELHGLYLEILAHEDNPVKIFGDYWTVKAVYGDTLGGEFGDLLKEMQTALKKYGDDYGVEITDVKQLSAAASSYLKVPAALLISFSENFTADKFKEYLGEITEILKVCGLVGEDFENCFSLPVSLEDYLEKTSAVIKTECEARLEENKQAYLKDRQTIDGEQYESYIRDVLSEYGTLDGFWNATH